MVLGQAKFNPPENFDFTKPAGWPCWKQWFVSRYSKATKLTGETGEVQASTLLYAMGPEEEDIVSPFTYTSAVDGDHPGETENDLQTVLGKFDVYFVPKCNVIHERAVFQSMTQKANESVEKFVRCLYTGAEHCGFHDKNEEIRDQLLLGLADKKLTLELQLRADLSLEMAIKMARER